MLERVFLILQQNCLLNTTKPILLGVSGGPDSLCLLDMFWRLSIPVVVAHFNHHLRPEADADAREVARVAESLGLPLALGSGDVAAFAGENALSVEEAARTLRYRFLFEEAKRSGAQAVAVAHTADDQVETVLMHLLRGAGLSGLRGMDYRSLPTAWSSEIPLWRPLLGTWREEILAYLAGRDLHPVLDASNLDTAYFRNRLRHELLPFLENYNPRLRQGLWRMAQILAADDIALQTQVEAAGKDCFPRRGPGYVGIAPDAFRRQPLGIQRRLVRRAMADLRPGLRDVDFDAVERAVEFLTAQPPAGQCDLLAGLRLFAEGERVWLAAWEADLPGGDWPQVPDGASLFLDAPGRLSLPGGWELRAEVWADADAARAQAYTNANPFQAWIDLQAVKLPLRVRGRLPGERFEPLGMGGRSLKLSDFMINFKLPKRARRNWPLVTGIRQSAPEVLWVPGFGLAHPFRLTEKTTRALYLKLKTRG